MVCSEDVDVYIFVYVRTTVQRPIFSPTETSISVELIPSVLYNRKMRTEEMVTGSPAMSQLSFSFLHKVSTTHSLPSSHTVSKKFKCEVRPHPCSRNWSDIFINIVCPPRPLLQIICFVKIMDAHIKYGKLLIFSSTFYPPAPYI